ncbi:MAG: AMP-binding protein [Ketobacter sp.]|nr:AMP-binding protein [Ketobacter sp.]
MLIHDILRRSAKLYPTTIAIDDGREQLTYQQLAERVDYCCEGFRSRELLSGSRVVVLGYNSVDYAVMFFACARLGLVLVPVNAYLQGAEIEWILKDCGAVAVIAGTDYIARLQQDCSEVLKGLQCFVLGPADEDHMQGWSSLSGHSRVRDYDPSTNESHQEYTQPVRSVVVQLYTSGTTGTPKGVLLSHLNIVSVVQAWLHEMPLKPASSRLMQATPLFHVGGMLICMCALASGSTLYLLPRFDAGLALDTLITKRITHTLLVPAMIQQIMMAPDIDSRDFSALEFMVYGASSMPEAVINRAMEVFGCGFLQGYGLTETAGLALSLRPEDHCHGAASALHKRIRSAGREMLCCEVSVVNDQGKPVSPDEVGEIVIRGDNVCEGYWNNVEATQETIVSGWLKTGDLGRVDEDGYIYVVDRLKDMIIVSGSNVYPAEVEDAMRRHPWIADVAVIGVPNAMLGEEVVAVIILTVEGQRELEAGSQRTLSQQLKLHGQQHLAAYKCPVRIKYVPALPRTPAGKVQKTILRDQLVNRQGALQ